VSGRRDQLAVARAFAGERFDADRLVAHLHAEAAIYRWTRPDDARRMQRAARLTVDVLGGLPGPCLADRWSCFEATVWPEWLAGRNRLPLGSMWTWGVWPLVTGRLVRPSWSMLSCARVTQWVGRLPDDDPLLAAHARLQETIAGLRWGGRNGRVMAGITGLRLLLVAGRDDLEALTEEDLRILPPGTKGADWLDLALCELGILGRGPVRGTVRRQTTERLTPAELVVASGIPERFKPVTALYLETYARRISDTYATLRHLLGSLIHFWQYIDHEHPEVGCCAEVRPAHARGFVEHSAALARQVRRSPDKGDHERITGYSWALNTRTFFADICTWATEPDSPFAEHAPPVILLTRHDLRGRVVKVRRQSAARVAATVLDLHREMPNIRAFALRRWHEAEQAAAASDDRKARADEVRAFWDWALLELLVCSGLRVEEACELTTLDVLKRRQPDGQTYYLLHVKPSKFGQARMIPIGDVLGRVIAEITRHVKRFYGSDTVPWVDRRDHHEKRPLPRAPYLLQGLGHPSAIGVNTIRYRLRKLSEAAGARRADGNPLILQPHDCRRLFASEQLNNNTPVHVIQALLGHATVDTVMIYAKLYPHELVEGYRRAMRGLYADIYGTEVQRTPSLEEWQAFATSCSLRDMGTHLCGLPTAAPTPSRRRAQRRCSGACSPATPAHWPGEGARGAGRAAGRPTDGD